MIPERGSGAWNRSPLVPAEAFRGHAGQGECENLASHVQGPHAACPTPAFLEDPALGQAHFAACESGILPTEVPGESGPHTTQHHRGFMKITPCHPLHGCCETQTLSLSLVCATLRLQRDEGGGGNQQGWGPRQAPGPCGPGRQEVFPNCRSSSLPGKSTP